MVTIDSLKEVVSALSDSTIVQWRRQLFMSGEAKGGQDMCKEGNTFFILYFNPLPLSSLHSISHPICTSRVTTFPST